MQKLWQCYFSRLLLSMDLWEQATTEHGLKNVTKNATAEKTQMTYKNFPWPPAKFLEIYDRQQTTEDIFSPPWCMCGTFFMCLFSPIFTNVGRCNCRPATKWQSSNSSLSQSRSIGDVTRRHHDKILAWAHSKMQSSWIAHVSILYNKKLNLHTWTSGLWWTWS